MERGGEETGGGKEKSGKGAMTGEEGKKEKERRKLRELGAKKIGRKDNRGKVEGGRGGDGRKNRRVDGKQGMGRE